VNKLKACPLCGSKTVGQIAPERYYCWDCLVEYDNKNQIYEVLEDGSLSSFEVPEPYL
jgi:uncharacterized OB-fold protein